MNVFSKRGMLILLAMLAVCHPVAEIAYASYPEEELVEASAGLEEDDIQEISEPDPGDPGQKEKENTDEQNEITLPVVEKNGIKEQVPSVKNKESVEDIGMAEALGPKAYVSKDAQSAGLSNTCGDNVFYSIENGTLRIWTDQNGEGRVSDYSGENSAPWYAVRKNIKKIIVEDGVSYVGDYAFARCVNLESVSLPSSLGYIGTKAFSYCDSLSDVSVEDWDGITLASGNSGIKTAYDTGSPLVPASTKKAAGSKVKWEIKNGVLYITGSGRIEDYKFQEAPWCSKADTIKKVVVGSGITYIGSYAFTNLKKAEEYEIAESVTGIGARAFYKNQSLKSLELPPRLLEIGTMAFQDCSVLSSVNIPKNIDCIPYYCFCNCYDLKNITLPVSIKTIQPCAFFNTSLSDVAFGGTSKEWASVSVGTGNSTLKKASLMYIGTGIVYPEEEMAETSLKGIQTILAPSLVKLREWSLPYALAVSSSGNGALVYRSQDKNILTVSKKGVLTVKGNGTARITVSSSDSDDYYAAVKQITVSVRGAAGTKIYSALPMYGQVRIMFRKRYTYNGYEIQYAKNNGFNKDVVTEKISSPDMDSYTVSPGKAGTWYIRIRTKKTVDGKDYYSDWTPAKKVKI